MGNSRLLKIRVPRIQIHDLSVSDRDPLAKFCELILAFVIANIHWQKLVMHQMFIFGRVPLATHSLILPSFCPAVVSEFVSLNLGVFVYSAFRTVNNPENGAEPYSSGIASLPLLLMN